MSEETQVRESRISGLSDLMEAARNSGLPPVERWTPPYCGDIGLRISRDGRWHYAGSPIGRDRLVRLFSRVLIREADGRHFLVTPAEKVDVDVEDAPFLAVEMQVDGADLDQTVTFRTNVDDVVTVSEDNPLRFEVDGSTGGLKPYVLVRGRLEALVTRSLVMDLVALGETGGDDDGLAVLSSGARFTLPAT